MNYLFNLQLFSDGGDGGEAATNASVNGDSLASQDEDLSTVMYGKSNKAVVEPTDIITPEDKSKAFENMIKKGGDYADEFNKRTQDIINKRFKETKNLEAQLKNHQQIMETLANRYGIDANDIDALKTAIDEDDSMYEEAAFKEGLTTKQYREKLSLMRENERLKAAEQEARERQHSEEIYSNWVRQSEELVGKYNLQNFDLASEMQNPDFTSLLANGIDFEAAYKAVHLDEMLGGAMAHTAQEVEKKVANRIASRQARPAENAVMSSNTNTMKSDVNRLTDSDIDEVIKRVRAGETISFG